MAKSKSTTAAAPIPPPKSTTGNGNGTVIGGLWDKLKLRKPTTQELTTYYLITYNTLNALAWSYLLILTIAHLSGYTNASKVPPVTTASASISGLSFSPYNWVKKGLDYASPYLTAANGRKPLPPPNASYFYFKEANFPKFAITLLQRARTLYGVVGVQTTWIQSFAILEILHAATGLVRANLVTTLMQVASRYYLVWIVTENFESARSNSLYASLLLSWSTTEIIRYTFYTSSLLPSLPLPSSIKPYLTTPYWLLYLRYSTFYILYPTGAASEAFLNYATLPSSSPVPSSTSWGVTWSVLTGRNWNLLDYTRAGLFLVWWPALYILMSHMVQQRAKALGTAGGGGGGGVKGKKD